MLFVDWIILRIVNNWSSFLFDSLKSLWIVLLLFIILVTPCSIIITKYMTSKKTKVVILSCISLFYVILVIVPFLIGKDKTELLSLGYKIADAIEHQREINSTIPRNLDEIKLKLLSEDEMTALEKNFNYEFIDHIEYNKRLFDKSRFIYEDDYILQIHPWYMGNEFYRYNKKTKQFIVTDD